jgi:hypothetical protein
MGGEGETKPCLDRSTGIALHEVEMRQRGNLPEVFDDASTVESTVNGEVSTGVFESSLPRLSSTDADGRLDEGFIDADGDLDESFVVDGGPELEMGIDA